MNSLTDEKSDGWVLLFDGKTTEGWKNFNEDRVSGWHRGRWLPFGTGPGW